MRIVLYMQQKFETKYTSIFFFCHPNFFLFSFHSGNILRLASQNISSFGMANTYFIVSVPLGLNIASQMGRGEGTTDLRIIQFNATETLTYDRLAYMINSI